MLFSLWCSSRKPPHVPVFFTRHPWRASHFLLLAQEKVTKEKGTPAGAVGRRPTARGRYGGSLTGHPWPVSELAGLLPATLRAFSSASSPRPRGTPKSQSRWAKAHPIKAFPSPACGGRCRRRKGALLILAPCGAAKGGRKGPKGRREGSRRFRCGTGCAVSGTRPPVANPQRSCGRPTRGALLFGYFLLGKQEKVTRAQGCAWNRTGTWVGFREEQQEQSEGAGPGFRRDDEGGVHDAACRSKNPRPLWFCFHARRVAIGLAFAFGGALLVALLAQMFEVDALSAQCRSLLVFSGSKLPGEIAVE